MEIHNEQATCQQISVAMPNCNGLCLREDSLIAWIYNCYGAAITDGSEVLGVSVVEDGTIINFASLKCTQEATSFRAQRCALCAKLRKK